MDTPHLEELSMLDCALVFRTISPALRAGSVKHNLEALDLEPIGRFGWRDVLGGVFQRE